jgi:UV DNA damage endonuclease
LEQPIKFRTTTAAALARLERDRQLDKLAEIACHNAAALAAAIRYCAAHGIGAFRVNSQILPLRTHPAVGYRVDQLPVGTDIVERFMEAGRIAAALDVRLSFHPDQFVVLNSPRPEVVDSSLAELEYQTEVADWIGADVINIHAGGAYGNKPAALAALERNLQRLSAAARRRLTLENDDKLYSPCDLLPLCRQEGVPLVYDVHHHRCLPDMLDEAAATEAARATWNREPLFHLSSPRHGWNKPQPAMHHDYIDPSDFPVCWRGFDLTVEVEAKAKELAVERLRLAMTASGALVRAATTC